jgi:hypothetical protein
LVAITGTIIELEPARSTRQTFATAIRMPCVELVDPKTNGRATTPRAITEPLNLHPPEPKKQG